MKQPPQPVPTKAEMEILQILWRLGAATVRQIHEQIERKTAYTTILKMLQIMTEKELVTRETGDKAHLYRAKTTQTRATKAFIGDLVERVFSGSAQKLVMQALCSQKASPDELQEIRELIDRLEKR